MTDTETSGGRDGPARSTAAPRSASPEIAARDAAGAQDRLRRQRTARASRRAARLQRLGGAPPVLVAG